ncbi:MAG TPA: FtsX-like permease family protein [Blastocatellia bacterium]|nr:FtsX-like permease family protein [Blastocatellia bacterium]
MKFILEMARRELRSSWRRLLFFFLCIAIGVGSIVAGRSMLQNASIAIASEARTILTADVQVDTNRPWTPETLAIIERVSAPLISARTETIEATTMLRPADATTEGAALIELKGIDPGFPLVGDFRLADGRQFDSSMLSSGGAIVSIALLDRLKLDVGDRVKIGNSTFQIRGAFENEVGGGTGFRIGTRVFIERSAVEPAGLTGFGSRARRKTLFTTLPDKMQPLTKQLRAELDKSLINVRSYKDSQENLNEQFLRAENYSSLTGLAILVLGGIGISNVTRVFLEQKRKTIAVLKCIGGTGRRITASYLTQVIAMSLLGSSIGLVFGWFLLWLIKHNFSSKLPSYMTYGMRSSAIIQGITAGALISFLFSVVPLLRIRHIKPNALLRDDEKDERNRIDILRWVVATSVLLCLLLLVSWQAGSVRVGLIFLAGLGATAGLLYLAATALIILLKRTRRFSSFALKQALSSLHRPGNQTRVTVMVVGLGVFLVISVQSVESNLVDELDLGKRTGVANMYLIDIQRDQQDGVSELVQQQIGERPTLVPVIRARISAIHGKEIDQDQSPEKRDQGRLRTEYQLTYRGSLEANETIVGGKFWDNTPSDQGEASLEESMRGLLGLEVGSDVTFDVAGKKINARVTSFRRVDWRNSRTGFMILFRPGVLESAPQMMVAAINGPTGEIERSRFQRVISDRFSNVTVVDVVDIVRSIERIVNSISLAVSFVGLFVVLSGGLILAGSLAMTKFQRVYEAAVLKTLGAKRKTLLKILLFEYGLMGLVAGAIGSGAAIGLAYGTSKYVFEIPWTFTPAINFGGIGLTIALVVVVGAVSTLDVISRKPLTTLRSQ